MPSWRRREGQNGCTSLILLDNHPSVMKCRSFGDGLYGDLAQFAVVVGQGEPLGGVPLENTNWCCEMW
jgi:hypothetical protein